LPVLRAASQRSSVRRLSFFTSARTHSGSVNVPSLYDCTKMSSVARAERAPLSWSNCSRTTDRAE